MGTVSAVHHFTRFGCESGGFGLLARKVMGADV